jgi:hypothetical protein
MRRLTPIFPILIASSLVAVVLTAQGQGRSSEFVTCSSAAAPAGHSLTGTWISNDKRTYLIRQIGTCVWWAGSFGRRVENVFFGAISSTGSTVLGVWADVRATAPPDTTGRLVFTVRASGLPSPTLTLVRRGSGGKFVASRLTRRS